MNGLDWFLFIDQPDYHAGPNHYIPFGTDDLAADAWQPLGAKLRENLPQNSDGGKPRHGTVIPVTRAEYQRMLGRTPRPSPSPRSLRSRSRPRPASPRCCPAQSSRRRTARSAPSP